MDRLPCMPITMMFAADRVPAPYGEYATNYHILAEGQLRVAEEFDVDHVSVISDPGVEAADYGATVIYYEDHPPAIDETNALLADKAQLLRLQTPEPADGRRMSNRINGVALLKERAGKERWIEGWVEGPCAEAADLRGINTLMTDFFDDPGFVRDLFEWVVERAVLFAREQIQAGADIIGIGDAAASLIGLKLYRDFVWPYEARLVARIREMGGRTRLHICGNTRRILEPMGRLGCDIVDLDFLSPLSEGRTQMGPKQILLGNIDPVRTLRDGTPNTIRAALAECHRQAGARYIVGAGCETPRDTPDPNLKALAAYACNPVEPGDAVP